jgi:hypothetical protein
VKTEEDLKWVFGHEKALEAQRKFEKGQRFSCEISSFAPSRSSREITPSKNQTSVSKLTSGRQLMRTP